MVISRVCCVPKIVLPSNYNNVRDIFTARNMFIVFCFSLLVALRMYRYELIISIFVYYVRVPYIVCIILISFKSKTNDVDYLFPSCY